MRVGHDCSGRCDVSGRAPRGPVTACRRRCRCRSRSRPAGAGPGAGEVTGAGVTRQLPDAGRRRAGALAEGPLYQLAGPCTTYPSQNRDKSRSYSRVLIQGPAKGYKGPEKRCHGHCPPRPPRPPPAAPRPLPVPAAARRGAAARSQTGRPLPAKPGQLTSAITALCVGSQREMTVDPTRSSNPSRYCPPPPPGLAAPAEPLPVLKVNAPYMPRKAAACQEEPPRTRTPEESRRAGRAQAAGALKPR
jgi:hypothetical protein